MKKIILILIALLVISTALFGCTQATDSNNSANQNNATDNTINQNAVDSTTTAEDGGSLVPPTMPD